MLEIDSFSNELPGRPNTLKNQLSFYVGSGAFTGLRLGKFGKRLQGFWGDDDCSREEWNWVVRAGSRASEDAKMQGVETSPLSCDSFTF